MRIDNVINEFCEKYDRDAMKSIEDISSEIGLVQNNITIKGFNMNEAFKSYTAYLKGYAEFMELAAVEGSKEAKTMEKSSYDEVAKSFDKYIDTKVINEEALTYDKLPQFISSFIEGVRALNEDVKTIKDCMFEADVPNELIGNVNDYTDKFIDKVVESMDPVMNEILWASGYNSKKKLFTEKKKNATVFA